MPIYNYKCSVCLSDEKFEMNVAKFLSFKKEVHACNLCGQELLLQVAASFSKIHKDKEAFMEEVSEYARNQIDRMNHGDEKVLRDICGEEKN